MKTLALALGLLLIVGPALSAQGVTGCPTTYILIATVSPLPSGAVGAAYSHNSWPVAARRRYATGRLLRHRFRPASRSLRPA
jgi:hypothetical protein